MLFRTIGIATDLSLQSKRAAHWALALAQHCGARLVLLHVDELSDPRVMQSLGTVPATFDALARHHRRALEHGIEAQKIELMEMAGEISVEAIVRGGGIADTFAEHIRELQIDLLVVGSHGERGSLKALLASSAAKISRVSPCPVLVVRDELENVPPIGFERIVVAVDYSDASADCLRAGGSLLAASGTLECVHVWEEPSWVTLAGGGDDDGNASAVVTETLSSEVKRAERFISDNKPAVEVRARLLRGHPTTVLLEQAAQAELIIVGSHRRHGVEHIVGTVADRVLRHSEVPVLLVPHTSSS